MSRAKAGVFGNDLDPCDPQFSGGGLRILRNTRETQGAQMHTLAMADDCTYVIDHKKELLLSGKGFKQMFGVEDRAVDLGFVYSGFHPNDERLAKRIIRSAIRICKAPWDRPDGTLLSLTYRKRTLGGRYVSLLHVCKPLELDGQGRLSKSISRLSDISFVRTMNSVNWSFRSPRIEEDLFRKGLFSEDFEALTERELEVVRGMSQGWSNQHISDAMCISIHTVATHRKNIFRKTDCHNALELVHYCRVNGLLS